MSERKSGKQRREDIKQKRLERAARLQAEAARPDARWINRVSANTPGVEPANREILARYNNTYGELPKHYLDRDFTCRDCGEQHVWTAKQQKWWYEVAHGHIDSRAVRCLPCRRKRRATARAPGSDLLRLQCDRLRALGESRPNTTAWQEIDAALASKWWGVRGVAIATLGRWGDAQSVARLKAIAEDSDSTHRWGSWAFEAHRNAMQALGECLPESELAWALECSLSRDATWPLYTRIVSRPVTFWEPVIVAEWRRNEPARLQRLLSILSMVPTDTMQVRGWRERFQAHEHPLVRQAAQYAWRSA